MPSLPHLMGCGHPSTQLDPSDNKCRVCTGKFSGKFDGGKLRWDLVPVHAMEEVVKVYTHGAKKYAPDNYLENPFAWRRALAALKRHVAEWEKFASEDHESGCLHLAHVIWNALTLMEYERLGIGKDDRWRPIELSVSGHPLHRGRCTATIGTATVGITGVCACLTPEVM